MDISFVLKHNLNLRLPRHQRWLAMTEQVGHCEESFDFLRIDSATKQSKLLSMGL